MASDNNNVILLIAKTQIREIFNHMLSEEFTVYEADDCSIAIEKLKKHPEIMTILVEYELLNENNFMFPCDAEKYCHTPVIAITSSDIDEQDKALSCGVIDVICPPYYKKILLQRIKNQTIFCKNYIEKSREQLLIYDSLTGLLNRDGFYQKSRIILDENPDIVFYIIYIDIDRFKAFNDSFGLNAGDKLLMDIGKILLQLQNETCVFGRLDSDHFVCIHPKNSFEYLHVNDKIFEWLRDYPTEFQLNVSMGIYEVTEPNIGIFQMCDRALIALHSVKNSYINKVAFYSEDMRHAMLEEQELTGEMDKALASNQFIVYFQPQVNYDGGCLIGAEALVRWKHPTRGLIPPGRFIPLFEKNGFITRLDEYVWDKTCMYLKRWRSGSPQPRPITISVNVSRIDLYDSMICYKLKNLVDKYELPPSALRLEITESAYMQDSEQLIQMVEKLKALGFIVETDDFGSGYSSLNMLKDVNVDLLKLDMRFLSSGKDTARTGNILSSVVRMAHWLKMPVIAEGVETKEQAEFLKSLGTFYMQGYYFGKPMPAEEFEQLLLDYDTGDRTRYSKVNVEEMEEFWDPSAQNALIFNGYIGSAAIMEYNNGCFESVRANDRFFQTIGVTRQDNGHFHINVMDCIKEEYIQRFVSLLDEAIRTENEISGEFELKTIGDATDEKWLLVHGKLLAKNIDRYLFFISLEDITEHKKLERDLNEATAETKAIISNLDAGIIKCVVNGCIWKTTFVSDGLCELLGFTREELILSHVTYRDFLVHPDDEDKLRLAKEQIIREGGTLIEKFRIRHKDGYYMWCMIKGKYYKEGEMHGTFYGCLSDVSHVVTMEQQMDAIRSNVPGGIVIYDIIDGVEYINYYSDGVVQLFGYTKEEIAKIRDTGVENVLHPDDTDRVMQSIQNAIENVSEFREEYRVRCKDEHYIWVKLIANPVKDQDGNIKFYGLYTDISKRKLLEAQII